MKKLKPASEDVLTWGEASWAVIAFLETQPYGEAGYMTLLFHLPAWIELSPKHREPQNVRTTEPKWFAGVRNIASHSNDPGNPIREGILVKRNGGGFQLASRVKKPPATISKPVPEKPPEKPQAIEPEIDLPQDEDEELFQ